jgi:putative hydrolase of the HAD superfamily
MFRVHQLQPDSSISVDGGYPGVVAAFDRAFMSSELGLRKPERAAFEAIAEAIGISSSAMLFFDDTVENVEGARLAGLQAVHVRTPLDVKRALVDIGVL